MAIIRFLMATFLAVSSSAAPRVAASQNAGMETGPAMTADDMKAMAAHMETTSPRPLTRADSLRAVRIVTELRAGIAKYRDVRIAVDDGFRQFAPQLKNQRVYHFTNYRWGFQNAFRFNAAKPTSLLYAKDSSGSFVLVGAMYTAPKRHSANDLDQRVPLSVAQWHRHINWCFPPKREVRAGWRSETGDPCSGHLASRLERSAIHPAEGSRSRCSDGWFMPTSTPVMTRRSSGETTIECRATKWWSTATSCHSAVRATVVLAES